MTMTTTVTVTPATTMTTTTMTATTMTTTMAGNEQWIDQIAGQGVITVKKDWHPW
jgi:hypothetical protein